MVNVRRGPPTFQRPFMHCCRKGCVVFRIESCACCQTFDRSFSFRHCSTSAPQLNVELTAFISQKSNGHSERRSLIMAKFDAQHSTQQHIVVSSSV